MTATSDLAAHERFRKQRRFGSLDGLRAISILGVIWHHTAPSWANETLHIAGAQGVVLFFAISGFLITTLLLRERERNGAVDLRAFYLRRTLRIFPLYYGVLLIYIVAVAMLEKDSPDGREFFGNLLYFATYTSNLFVPLDGRVIFYFAWSLAAEEQFYLVWPGVLYFTRNASMAVRVLSVVLIICIAGQAHGNRFLSAVPVAIVAGALIATLLHQPRSFEVLNRILGQAWSVPVLLIALVLALSNASLPPFVVHLLFVALVGSCVIREKQPLAPLLMLKPLAYIGAISYGMYMFHLLCKNAVTKIFGVLQIGTDNLMIFAATVLLSTVVAAISFRYYESFFLRLKRDHQS